MSNLTEEELKAAVPVLLRTMLITHFTCEVPRTHALTLEALTKAIDCLIPAVCTWRQCHLYFGRSPFVRRDTDVDISVTFHDCAGMAIDDSIYIDCFQIQQHPIHLRVAVILEELCHYHLNIKSDALVRNVVAFLYAGVIHDPAGPRYCLNPNYHSESEFVQDPIIDFDDD